MNLLPGCESGGKPVNPEPPLGASAVRDCLRAAGSFPETPPSAIRALPKLNALVRSAKRGHGAVRTPPPDPTHTGSVVAYFLLFESPASAQSAAAPGREAVLEFRNRFRSSVSSGARYEMAVVQRNVLTLYLEDPSAAEAQDRSIKDCLGGASNAVS